MSQIGDASGHRTQIMIAVIAALGGIAVAVIGLFGTLAATNRTIAPSSPSPAATATVTAAGPTVTIEAPGPTVTATVTTDPGEPDSSDQVGEVTHLADSSQSSSDLLVDSVVSNESNVDIDGKRYDYAWKWYAATYNPTQVVVGVNANQEYSVFEAQLGLAGDSKNNSGKIGIVLDGKEYKTYRVSVTESHKVRISVKGVQRIEVRAYVPSGQVTYALGDPVLRP